MLGIVRTDSTGWGAASTLALMFAGVVLLAAIAFGAFILLQNDRGATAQALPSTISVTDAAAKRDTGAFLLDVREPSEWADFHVSGTTLIPLGQLSARLSEVPKNKDIVVMCRTGVRSAEGRDILLQAGYSRVTSMAGGLMTTSAQATAAMITAAYSCRFTASRSFVTVSLCAVLGLPWASSPLGSLTHTRLGRPHRRETRYMRMPRLANSAKRKNSTMQPPLVSQQLFKCKNSRNTWSYFNR